MSPMPVIWAPFVPLIPFGYCSQSIDGQDLISRSRTIAKCCVTFWPPLKVESRRPRSASSRVISPNLSAPLSVNCINTIGSPVVVSKSCARARELEIGAAHLGHRPCSRPAFVGSKRIEVEEIRGRVDRVDAGADDLADAAREGRPSSAARRRSSTPSGACPSRRPPRPPCSAAACPCRRPGRRAASSCRRRGTTSSWCSPRREPADRRGASTASPSRSGSPARSIDGATRLASRSKSSSWAVLPRISITCSGFLTPGQVDHDLVVALLADLGLRDAEPVDAVAEDLDRAVEVGLLQRPVGRRHRLQRHLEAALEVEPEGRRLLDRRPGNGEQPDADESGGDQRDEGEVRSTVHGSSGVG